MQVQLRSSTRRIAFVLSADEMCTKKGRRGQLSRTCRPAFALWDFGALPAASFVPAFPPVDLPFPPAISICRGGGLEWRAVVDDYEYGTVIRLL